MYNLNIPGYMTEGDLIVVESLSRKLKPEGVIVEIGSLMGRSSVCWAASCDPTTKIYCIDIFKENFSFNFDGISGIFNTWDEFKKNTEEFKNIIPIRGKSPEGISYPGDNIDILFIDTDHSTSVDLNNFHFYRKFFKPTTIICGHDYNFYTVEETAKYIAGIYNKPLSLYEGSTMWSVQI